LKIFGGKKKKFELFLDQKKKQKQKEKEKRKEKKRVEMSSSSEYYSSSDDDFSVDDESSDGFVLPPPKTSQTKTASKKKAAPKKPAAKKASKPSPPKKQRVAKKPSLSDDESDDEVPSFEPSRDDDDVSVLSSDEDVEFVEANKESRRAGDASKYKKVSQLEHILLRPDTYVGSTELVKQTMWVWSERRNRMVERAVEYVPALYKIYDEIVVNAADHAVNCEEMDTVKIDIDVETSTISVWNNGDGIPVVEHPKEKVYTPHMIFGMLLTSSNYDDGEAKLTGGRNGYGAKLANVFSREFTIETYDATRGLLYKQTFTDNMQKAGKAKITKPKRKAYTKVSFRPDLKRFHMERLSDDVVAMMQKRAFDVAACNPRLKVYLNGARLPVTNFLSYVKLFLGEQPGAIAHELVKGKKGQKNRWEVAVALSDGEPKQVSFVNSIWTVRGGSHVDHVTSAITRKLVEQAGAGAKAKKKSAVKPFHIKQHMFVFVRSLIINPSFDSQTKETLTTKVAKFGSRFAPSADFFKRVGKVGIIDAALEFAAYKEAAKLEKTGGRKKMRVTGIPKLDDANDAGSRNSQHCTLILTEGDSAKTLAISGLAVVGRDRYGVFPLRGKMLNVRDASTKQVLENAEVSALKRILGLRHKINYEKEEARKTLRYGHVMIMTDQDHDGSHIKGLLINFFHHFWPSLLRVPGFLLEFITPIVKVRRGKGPSQSFYTMPEYLEWKSANDGGRGWTCKYYKGLGTSTPAEAREYFRELERHKIAFKYTGESDDERIDMAFAKRNADARKDWLRGYAVGTFLDQDVDELSYTDFIDKELILFSIADCQRSIPSVMDGLKPGQRKVLYGAFKRNLVREVKVAQLAGYVSEQASYHHGEAALQGTIVNMAQTFVGSNNINLLFPAGQFGSRLHGGKDHASARYINTRLSKIARTIFMPEDDPLLTYLDDDGFAIEPEFYAPIIPMALVNGADGIGTGWSTTVLNYSPHDIVDNLRRLLRGDEPVAMFPWYKGFVGTIEQQPHKDGAYLVRGHYLPPGHDGDDLQLRVLELPIRVWTQPFKELLEKHMQVTGAKGIADYKEYHTDTIVDFDVTLTAEQAKQYRADPADFEKRFKLYSTLNTTNMHLFDHNGRIRKYETPLEVLREFYQVRLELYAKRKEYMVAQLKEQLLRLQNQCRFIRMVISGELEIRNKPKRHIAAELDRLKFDRFTTSISQRKYIREGAQITETVDADAAVAGASTDGAAAKAIDDGDGSDDDESDSGKEALIKTRDNQRLTPSEIMKGYQYLLGMQLWALSKERVQKLESQCAEREKELNALLARSPKQLWLADLDRFVHEYETIAAQEYRAAQEVGAEFSGAAVGKGKSKGKAKGRGRGKKAAPKTRIRPRPQLEQPDRAEHIVADETTPGYVKESGRKRSRSTSVKKEKMDDDNDDDKENIKKETPAKKEPVKKAPAKKAPAKKAPAKKKRVMTSSSDEDDVSEAEFSSSDDEDDIVVPVAPIAARRQARSRAKVLYRLDSSSDDDDGNNSPVSDDEYSFNMSDMSDF
jgi:DNA topoisomerase II